MSDPDEATVVTSVDHIRFSAGQEIERVVSRSSAIYTWALNNIGSVARVDSAIEGIEFRVSADYYIYSFCYEKSVAVQKSFSGNKPFDRVAKISDIYGLAESLVEVHPALSGLYYMVSPIIYRDRRRGPTQDHPQPHLSAFEKDYRFQNNMEGRIVFFKFDPEKDTFFNDYQFERPADVAHPEIRKWFSRDRLGNFPADAVPT